MHWVFADFVRFLEAPDSVMSCNHNGDNAVKGGPAAKQYKPNKGVH